IEEEDFSNGCLQLALILGSTQQSQSINMEKDIDIAYSSQRMKRRVAGSSTSVPNNRFSSLVSYLSSNESARPGIPRQNR
ncbi:3151_t:CDS:2, partial [Gigaspora margarita]